MDVILIVRVYFFCLCPWLCAGFYQLFMSFQSFSSCEYILLSLYWSNEGILESWKLNDKRMKPAKIYVCKANGEKLLNTNSHMTLAWVLLVWFSKAIAPRGMCSHDKSIICGYAHSCASLVISGVKSVSFNYMCAWLAATCISLCLPFLVSMKFLPQEIYLIADQNFRKDWCCKASGMNSGSLNLRCFKDFPAI